MGIYVRYEQACSKTGPYLELVAHTLNFYSIEIRQITLTQDLERRFFSKLRRS